MYIFTVIFLVYKFNKFGDGDTELSTIILHSLNKLSELKETLGLLFSGLLSTFRHELCIFVNCATYTE
jgi:hypothetical protein